ncbi:hypothetical protein GH733_004373 [Mirounga leonina]|nr:hypothetical protein GH733_004373 [Mirounga leonina]
MLSPGKDGVDMKIDRQVSDKYRYAGHLYGGTLGITLSVNSGQSSSLKTQSELDLMRITALPTGVLQIYDVGQRDAGNYRCVAATVAHRPEESDSFHTPAIIAGPQNITASLHQTAVFECVATGNPKPLVSWSRLVPLRPPEISLTSRSPTDILISWLPIPAKYRRGQVVLYRLSFRLSTETSIQVLELPGTTHEYLLEGLKPDSVYLVRITAATRVGLGESSWQQDAEDTATIQGYKLYYKEEGQQEHGPIFLDTGDLLYTLSGLDPARGRRHGRVLGLPGIARAHIHRLSNGDKEKRVVYYPFQWSLMQRDKWVSGVNHYYVSKDPRRKYHVRLLAYNNVEDGYQADQTVSTPGCVCNNMLYSKLTLSFLIAVRDRMVPPPPPPHHLYAKANSSSSIFLHWRRPAFTTAQIINYTIRCNPVGLQNASLVLYLQTYVASINAPAGPPIGVKVTLIEDDTALVSWKPPDGPETVVTRYTILYASRKAWIAGEWQVLHREGAITMALLENLVAGNVYIVKISASNEVGEGPFSNSVELAVLPKETPDSNQRPKRLDSADAKGLYATTVTELSEERSVFLQLSCTVFLLLPQPYPCTWSLELLPVRF